MLSTASSVITNNNGSEEHHVPWQKSAPTVSSHAELHSVMERVEGKESRLTSPFSSQGFQYSRNSCPSMSDLYLPTLPAIIARPHSTDADVAAISACSARILRILNSQRRCPDTDRHARQFSIIFFPQQSLSQTPTYSLTVEPTTNSNPIVSSLVKLSSTIPSTLVSITSPPTAPVKPDKQPWTKRGDRNTTATYSPSALITAPIGSRGPFVSIAKPLVPSSVFDRMFKAPQATLVVDSFKHMRHCLNLDAQRGLEEFLGNRHAHPCWCSNHASFDTGADILSQYSEDVVLQTDEVCEQRSYKFSDVDTSMSFSAVQESHSFPGPTCFNQES